MGGLRAAWQPALGGRRPGLQTGLAQVHTGTQWCQLFPPELQVQSHCLCPRCLRGRLGPGQAVPRGRLPWLPGAPTLRCHLYVAGLSFLWVKHLWILFVYFTTVYIFIAYFYQGFLSSYACILCNKFCVQGPLVHIYVTLNLPSGSTHWATTDLCPRAAPSSPQVTT